MPLGAVARVTLMGSPSGSLSLVRTVTVVASSSRVVKAGSSVATGGWLAAVVVGWAGTLLTGRKSMPSLLEV